MKNEIGRYAVNPNATALTRDIIPMLSKRVSGILELAAMQLKERLEEIRLRADKPLMLLNYNREWFVSDSGSLLPSPNGSFVVRQEDIRTSLELMSENSIYAYQEEIRSGYLTIRGGHRIGISGKAVMDGENVKNIRDVSGLNIRISNQIPGCSEKIVPYVIKSNSEIYNTLIISPPQCGKTTILRDIARILSNGYPQADFKGVKVGIVDERSELAACMHGVPQNDVGLRTDVLDGFPKKAGMAMMIRSMSPNVIITDEIGNEGDREAVHCVLNAGVRIVTSAHGYNVSELKSRREVLRMMEDKVFDRYIVLGSKNGPGTLLEVMDGRDMKPLTGAGIHAF